MDRTRRIRKIKRVRFPFRVAIDLAGISAKRKPCT